MPYNGRRPHLGIGGRLPLTLSTASLGITTSTVEGRFIRGFESPLPCWWRADVGTCQAVSATFSLPPPRVEAIASRSGPDTQT